MLAHDAEIQELMRDIKDDLQNIQISLAILEDRRAPSGTSEERTKRPYNRKTKAIEHKKEE